MANPKLSDKYKGKSFGEISKMIESKYKDRFDPISNRGKMAEMQSLRDEQDYQKQKIQIQENLKQILAQASQPQQPQQAQQMQAPQGMDQIPADNSGVGVPMPQEQSPAFNHAASQSYNQQFDNGGLMKYGLDKFGTPEFGNTPSTFSFAPQAQMTPVQENINPMRYAPLVANIANLIGSRRSPSTTSSLNKMGIDTQVTDEGSKVLPRQTQFNNIDYSGIERGINSQARGFTGSNANASNGNAGSFLANELGNQSNVMNAITQARMAQQQGNQQVDQMNAQEQGRIDSINLNQAQNSQQVQGQNIGIGMQMADLDARNEGAFTTNRNAQIAGLATNLGSIGREEDQMKMIANSLGYSSFGNFMESMTPEEREKALPSLKNLLAGVFKTR